MERSGSPPHVASGVLVHDGERSRITRVFVDGRTVIRKEPVGPGARRRLIQEREVLVRLRGLPGIAQLLDSPLYPGSLVLADGGGPDLARRPRPWAVDALLPFSAALARAVAAMHRRDVLHGDITPANVVVDPDGAPLLVDFALARTFAEIGPDAGTVARGSAIVGTLRYLAPEQTGRTGRPVDQRADLYSLGATLYELATGTPPFGSDDPLLLMHDHLAHVPVPASEVAPEVPAALSDVIGRLLEKDPDNRYQTADGLAHDLEYLTDALGRRSAAPLLIGTHDARFRLRPPTQLVGRDAETATLTRAFESALTGGCRAVFVGGGPGVGKTALVEQLRPVVAAHGGWFVAGKFDQYRRNLAASGVHQAFRALGRLLLA